MGSLVMVRNWLFRRMSKEIIRWHCEKEGMCEGKLLDTMIAVFDMQEYIQVLLLLVNRGESQTAILLAIVVLPNAGSPSHPFFLDIFPLVRLPGRLIGIIFQPICYDSSTYLKKVNLDHCLTQNSSMHHYVNITVPS